MLRKQAEGGPPKLNVATAARAMSSADHLNELAEPNGFDLLWAQLALIGITVSVCNGIVYYPLRLGLSNPPLLVPSCVLIVAASLLAPLMLPARSLLEHRNWRSVAMPLVSLLCFFTVPLGIFVHGWLLPIYAVIVLAGSWRALQLLKAERRLQIIFCIAVGVVEGFYLFCTVQGMNYAGLYAPEQSLLGILNHDTTFHTAIAYMIQNFGVPSTAIDGVLPIKYHFGSHFWFAGLGKIASSTPVFSYGAGVPIVLAPMVVMSLLFSAISIDRGSKPLTGYVLMGFGLIALSDIIGYQSYYISESYSCALIALLLLLPLLKLLTEEEGSSTRTTMAFAIAIAMIPLTEVMKVSVGALWAAAVGWVILRRYKFSIRTILLGTAAIAAFLIVFRALAPSTNDYQVVFPGRLIVPFFFFRLFGAASLSSFVIPLILLFSKMRIYGNEGLRTIIHDKSDLMFEATMVVLVIGALPALLGIPQDSADWYFLNVAQWMAMALLIDRYGPDWSPQIAMARATPLLIIGFCTALTLAPGVYLQMTSLLTAADNKSGGHLLNGAKPFKFFRDALTGEHVLWGNNFRDAVQADAGAQLIQIVRGAIPVPDRHTAVFVPPENVGFWSLFSKRCLDKYNTQVSMTGQPSLLGGIPLSYRCELDAYTSQYGTQFQSRAISDADLCEHALSRNIERVLIVAESRASNRNRILNCKSGAPR